MISIALATYNGEAYLNEQLESFINQDRLPDELIVSDDASTDSTIHILDDFRSRAPFEVHIGRNEEKLGITKNFEKAIFRCKGDIIFLSDQDDVWLPEKILKLSEVLEKDNNAGLVFCDAQIVSNNLVSTGQDFWDSVWFSRGERAKVRDGRAFEVFLRHSVAAAMSMAFRADLREIVLPIPDIWSIHDVWTALIISAVSEVRMIDGVLSKYRVHGNNQTVGIHRMNLYEQYRTAKRQLKDHTFLNLLRLNEEMYTRICDIGRNDKYNIKKDVMFNIIQKIEHLKCRDILPEIKLMRPGAVLSELLNRRYFKYSYGFKSAAQDLFLR